MESSTASDVDPAAPSRFRYFEQDGLVWGSYTGDTVTSGRFVGSRTGDALAISFAHVLADGRQVVTGSSASTVQVSPEGALRLVEEFCIEGQQHVSVCVEVA